MRAGIVVKVTLGDRRQLEAIVCDRNAPQKHVWRAKIILATAEGCGTAEIMRRSGKSKPVVWRHSPWHPRLDGVEEARLGAIERLDLALLVYREDNSMLRPAVARALSRPRAAQWPTLAGAVHGGGRLVRDKTRKPGKPPLARSMPSSTTMPPTNIPKCANGSPAIGAGPSFGVLAQRGRGLLRQARTSAPQARCVPIPRGAEGGHQPLRRRDKRGPKTVRLTADPNRVLAAVKRGKQTLESIH
jgi:hypothetical protein